MTPFARVVERLQAAGLPVRMGSSRTLRVRCPAHGDARPSLSVTARADDVVLLHCFAGCPSGAVLDRLGLRHADLYPAGHVRRRQSSDVVAVYDYLALDGTPLTKVRYEPKAFAWRGADGRRTLDGRVPGLYGLEHLPAHAGRVFVVEGEKAVDRLRAVGIAAVCGPAGAGHWRTEHTAQLRQPTIREVVILPDNDPPGEGHAVRVATELRAEGISAKVMRLPDLDRGADVVDWLAAGGCSEALQALADHAPAWDPDRDAREQLEARRARQRELTRLRVARHRASHPRNAAYVSVTL